MNDRIALRGIRVDGRHGANPGERDRPQPFEIDLELEVDLARARRSDDLADTLDYTRVHALVVATVEGTSFALLERLGDEILSRLMQDGRIAAVRLTLAKPGLFEGATPAVMLSARRDERSE
jgi:dihydroneopterin aldolase